MKITPEMANRFYEVYIDTEDDYDGNRTDVRAGLEAVAPMILDAYQQAALEIQGQLITLEAGVDQTWYQALQLVALTQPSNVSTYDDWVREAGKVYQILRSGPPS